MKIAIISDIHGNLEALKTTLEYIKKRNIDKIFCLGDIIAQGVHPSECIGLIRENCEVVVQGNTDYYFSIDHPEIDSLSELEQKRIRWNQSLITKEDRDYLSNLPFCYEFYLSGSLIRLFHATPTINYGRILNYDNFSTKYNMFLPSPNTVTNNVADVVIYGHLHHPYLDKIYNKTIINVGSVGASVDVVRNKEKDSSVLETTKSNFLIIEGEFGKKEYDSDISFCFTKIPYNIEKELENEIINIEKDEYYSELTQGTTRNMKRIKNDFKKLGINTDDI